MCKIILIPNASKITDIVEFSRFAAEALQDMGDGYGYVAQGDKGLFGVRSLDPMHHANDIKTPKFCETVTEPFGVVSKVVGGAMFHGRTSTNTISLLNTHPIARDNWALIHNGVVTNHGDKYSQLTTNDSEHVLYNLINGGIDSVAKNLTGYYACGAISPDGLFHVFRDSIAPLFYAWSEVLDSPIFATTEELITEIAEYNKEFLIPQKVKNDTYLVYNGKKRITHTEFISRGWDDYSKNLSGTSLGKDFSSEQKQWEGSSDVPLVWYKITEDYLDEYQYFDDSYQYYRGFKEISRDEFFELDLKDQILCKVCRHDGTEIDPYGRNESLDKYSHHNVTTIRKNVV